MTSNSSFRLVAVGRLVAACSVVGFVAASAAANDLPYLNQNTLRLWQKHIPDFYQHQKWGNGADPLLNADTWQTRPVKTKGLDGKIITFPVPDGWSRHAATANVFHHWRQRGFLQMGPTLTNSNWLNLTNATINTFAAKGSDVAFELFMRNHSQNSPLGQRLSYLTYERDGDHAAYRSANGSLLTVRAGGVPAPLGLVAAAEFAAGASVNAIVRKTGSGPFSTQLWWGNYHAMTLAGIDLGERALFLADPDSNKGNADTDAGWTGVWPDPAVEARKYIPWNGSSDTIPVPALGPGFPNADPVNFQDRFMRLTLADDLRTFDGNDVANGRYRNVQIDRLEVMRVTAAGTAPTIVPTEGLTVHSFEIGNGANQGFPIDELWLIPVTTLNLGGIWCEPTITVLDPFFEVEADLAVIPAGSVDPHGNVLQHDAFHIAFNPPLHTQAFAQLSFCTARGFNHASHGYDVLVRSRELGEILNGLPEAAQNLWPNADALFLPQSFGGEVPAYTPGNQTIDICVADFNGDGMVDGADLGMLLSAWGPSLDRDLTGDGVVDGADLGILLALWGPCKK